MTVRVSRYVIAERLGHVPAMLEQVNPVPLIKDEMWPGSGAWSQQEHDELVALLAARFNCTIPELLSATAEPGNFETQLRDGWGLALYVLQQPECTVFGIGTPGYKFDEVAA